ncbi:HD domain-containing protein [Candidatus Roizmanbacteria bacterium]|nr:HD domain-containing protein [Candidatus Roizmanbacteria bacterium]
MITRDQAYDKIKELISNQNLIKHCLAVEAAMRSYADHFNVSPSEKELWGIAGLVHDADWEKYPDKHPTVIIEWMKEQGASDELLNAIAAHGFNFGIEAKTRMAKTIRAVDELTGLLVAIALVKGRKLTHVTVESVLKKWNQKAFAAGVNRADIERGADELGIPLEEHIDRVLKSLQSIAPTLGL